MEITAAFLGPHADGLFELVAAFAGAAELETLDVSEGQNEARRAIGDAIVNAARLRANPGTRIALIKGEAGSGKTHVVTMTFRKMAAVVVSEVYPAVLQLTAPVKTSEYLNWVLDALFRELSARHFPDQLNQSPLRRLANRLLEVSESEKRDEFIVSIEDTDADRAVILAKQLAGKIRQRAIASGILSEQPPSAAFLAVILLAGFDDWSAISYLRQGYIDDQIRSLDLRPINNSGHRMAILRDLGLAAQIIGASLVLGFDQVENTVRLGDEGLFAHALVQATRIVEDVVNCAITVAVLADEYDRIVGGDGAATGLPASDRDRIERESPNPVRLEPGSPDFLLNVVARRLAVLRQRARLPEAPGSLEPLPNWLVARLREARSVRLTLNEVSHFQKMALRLGRIPTKQDYTGGAKEIPPSPKDEIDFDKLWVDFMDLAPATHIRLLDSTKAHLLAWWASEASREHLASDAAQVTASNLHGEFKTHVIDIRLKAHGHVIELRQLGLCEAPNRNQKLLQQVEEFLDSCTGTPAILRTKGFPRGRTAQVAPAIRRLNAIKGLKLDLSDTERNGRCSVKSWTICGMSLKQLPF